MLSKKLQSEGIIFSYALVSDLFASFHNPKYAGETFKWEDFPKMVSEMAEASCFMSIFCANDKTMNELKQYVKETSFRISKRMVERMQRD